MSRVGGTPTIARWLNPLLGTVLLLVAGLDLALLGGIGWAAWHKAALSEQWLQMRQEDRLLESGTQREAQELEAAITASRGRSVRVASVFPSDADAARYLTELRSQATALGITIIDLGPGTVPPTNVPQRRFTIRARGSWPQLVEYVRLAAQTALPTSRIEDVVLRLQGDECELSFDLMITVRPLDASVVSDYAEPGVPALSTAWPRQE